MQDILVIGDVHGHFDRLEALLRQEGLIDRCSACDGSGMHMDSIDDNCLKCHGDGWARTEKDALVVQLGDLGHFGKNGSPTGDMLCWRAAYNGWIDVVLWGNHDRAVVDPYHEYKNYLRPNPAVLHMMLGTFHQGRLQVAFEAHNFLLTHAGLALAFKNQHLADELKTDMHKFVEWINDQDDKYLETGKCAKQAMAVRDAIGSRRGGRTPTGGILWRDINEKLYTGWRQIFGHTKSKQGVVHYAWKNWHSGVAGSAPKDAKLSYCIDVGTQHNGALAGIWLPDERIVRVDL